MFEALAGRTGLRFRGGFGNSAGLMGVGIRSSRDREEGMEEIGTNTGARIEPGKELIQCKDQFQFGERYSPGSRRCVSRVAVPTGKDNRARYILHSEGRMVPKGREPPRKITICSYQTGVSSTRFETGGPSRPSGNKATIDFPLLHQLRFCYTVFQPRSFFESYLLTMI